MNKERMARLLENVRATPQCDLEMCMWNTCLFHSYMNGATFYQGLGISSNAYTDGAPVTRLSSGDEVTGMPALASHFGISLKEATGIFSGSVSSVKSAAIKRIKRVIAKYEKV